jgi:hypothetical protein
MAPTDPQNREARCRMKGPQTTEDEKKVKDAIRLLRIESKNTLADYCVDAMAAFNRILERKSDPILAVLGQAHSQDQEEWSDG